MARITLNLSTRNAGLAMAFGSQMFGDEFKREIAKRRAVLAEQIRRAMNGGLVLVTRIRTSHAISLDALIRRDGSALGKQHGPVSRRAERYMRLALKAQAACRFTLNALARLHQPHEQTVKHVHINQGGWAAVADHFHRHTGGQQIGNQSNKPVQPPRLAQAPRCLA